jgi:hypothetical protein
MKKWSLKFALAAALTVAALSIPGPTQAALLSPGSGCPRAGACPENYAPVICSNGVVYANSCFASLDCATGCVPYGDAI